MMDFTYQVVRYNRGVSRGPQLRSHEQAVRMGREMGGFFWVVSSNSQGQLVERIRYPR